MKYNMELPTQSKWNIEENWRHWEGIDEVTYTAKLEERARHWQKSIH